MLLFAVATNPRDGFSSRGRSLRNPCHSNAPVPGTGSRPLHPLRDGVSADIHVPVKELRAAKISPGILVLDDNGVVGVRTVENGIVHFKPVQIVSDGPDGMWVTGLRDGTTVITVGQEFVSEGSRVKPVMAGAHV